MFDENTKLGDFIRGMFVSSNTQNSTVETTVKAIPETTQVSTAETTQVSTAETNNGGEVVNTNVSQNTVSNSAITTTNANSGNMDTGQNSQSTGEVDKLKAEIERLQQFNQQLLGRVPVTNTTQQQTFEQKLLNLCVGEENLKNYAG